MMDDCQVGASSAVLLHRLGYMHLCRNPSSVCQTVHSFLNTDRSYASLGICLLSCQVDPAFEVILTETSRKDTAKWKLER
jgi:hypothetical protein